MIYGGHTCQFSHLDLISDVFGLLGPAEHTTVIGDKIQFLLIACRR